MAGGGAGGVPARTAPGRRRGASHVELELVARVRFGAEDPLATDDVEGEKGAGLPSVDQIHGQAEPPFEGVFEQQDLAQGLLLPEEDADVDVRLLGLFTPSPGTEQIERQDPGLSRREGVELDPD
jgi:hypothetical protein